MKYLFLLFSLIAFSSFGQELYLVPAELLDMANKSKVGPGLIQIKALNKTLDTVIYADGNHYYLISSADGNNTPGTKIRIKLTQVPITDQPDTVETVFTETVDDASPRFVISGATIKATNNVPANGFYLGTFIYRTNLSLPAKVTFKFTGSSFEWRGERKSSTPAHGSVHVIVDGIPYLVLLNEPLPKVQGNNLILLSVTGLANDVEHTIETVPVGNSQFVLDAITTYRKIKTLVHK